MANAAFVCSGVTSFLPSAFLRHNARVQPRRGPKARGHPGAQRQGVGWNALLAVDALKSMCKRNIRYAHYHLVVIVLDYFDRHSSFEEDHGQGVRGVEHGNKHICLRATQRKGQRRKCQQKRDEDKADEQIYEALM